MTKTTSLIALFALAAATLQAAPKTNLTAHDQHSLTVRIYDYAGLDEQTLDEAAQLAQALYARAGVQTRWIRCRISLDEPVYHPSCPETPGPDTLRMRIMPQTPTGIAGVNQIVFGFALTPSEKNQFGTTASVFWDRIAKQADRSAVTHADLLATVMAHEAGHLLLGLKSHSLEGLMSARWDKAQLRKMAQGGVRFQGKQRRTIQSSVAARIAAAQ